MNKIKYIIVFILLLLLSPSVYAEEVYVNEVNGYKVMIEDSASLLKDEELEKLKDIMIPITEYGNVLFKTTDSSSSSTS